MSKKLVAYFSASGVTAKVAKNLAGAAGADLYEIRPETHYTDADLNWKDKTSRSSVEMQSTDSRPALADKDADVARHDVVFVGFPIWWYTAPAIIRTFMESYDFAGKKVILFATSGGSGFGKAVEQLKACAPKAEIRERQQRADGLADFSGDVGIVHGVEMDAVHAVGEEVHDLLGGEGDARVPQGFRLGFVLRQHALEFSRQQWLSVPLPSQQFRRIGLHQCGNLDSNRAEIPRVAGG